MAKRVSPPERNVSVSAVTVVPARRPVPHPVPSAPRIKDLVEDMDDVLGDLRDGKVRLLAANDRDITEEVAGKLITTWERTHTYDSIKGQLREAQSRIQRVTGDADLVAKAERLIVQGGLLQQMWQLKGRPLG